MPALLRSVSDICLRQSPRLLSRRSRGFVTTASLKAKDFVRIVEVGPRDGLQNEKKSIPLETKVELVRRLAETGVETIEAGSFVSPNWVPQMANSSDLMQTILENTPPSPKKITYQWLLPNKKGLERYFTAQGSNGTPQQEEGGSSPSSSAPEAQAQHEIAIFTAATDTFSKKNTNCTIPVCLERLRPLVAEAKSRQTPVRAYISVALGCPYEGINVDPGVVAEMAAALLEMGSDQVSVADTTGMGTAPRTQALLQALKVVGVSRQDLAFHFHDTYGQALINTLVALEHGIRTFDSAVAGLGGCPFSPGATGNVATEDMLHFLTGLGVDTGVDIEKMAKIGEWISGELDKANESRAGKAILAKMG